ncbi:MAG TPA: acyl transferase [Lutibacter sp.]|nr:acyl transferase [Lutibacter sp.]
MQIQKPQYNLVDITNDSFQTIALKVFHYQAINNLVYKEYLNRMSCKIKTVNSLEKIPFLPISFFKTLDIITENQKPQQIFLSSGTTGTERSKHLVANTKIYDESFRAGFAHFFGNIKDFTIIALLPSYLEQKDSSLVYMISDLIKQTNNTASGFYLNDYQTLKEKLVQLDSQGRKVLLIGVTYALLDLIDLYSFQLKNTLIMETGGMKGRRKELIKEELHSILKRGFGVNTIYSEYGMTELLSQAYSLSDTFFQTPPWMKILIREVEDPFTLLPIGKSGGINIIDLANINSCSFIATQDLGKIHSNGKFEVLGRFDHSDIRGCNLMV